jgi:hypothetical protein
MIGKEFFSVRSAYRMLLSTRNRREEWLNGNASSLDFRKVEKSWASLWRIKIPEKIKLFVWRLAKQSLPTADVRHHRRMKCSLCGAEDSWKHSLLLCTMSKGPFGLNVKV